MANKVEYIYVYNVVVSVVCCICT